MYLFTFSHRADMLHTTGLSLESLIILTLSSGLLYKDCDCFHSFFEFSQTYMMSFYNSRETQRTCFCISFRTVRDKQKCLISSSACKFSLLRPSLRQQLVLVLCF